jgi:hypothetical protein
MYDMRNLSMVRPGFLVVDPTTGNTTPVGSGGGNTYKQACRVASTADVAGTYSGTAKTLTVTATGRLAQDGKNMTNLDRVLLKNQTDAKQNGIYDVTVQGATGTHAVLTRSSDCDASAEFQPGFIVTIAEGTVNADTIWAFTADAPFTLDTSDATFAAAPLAIVYGAAGDMAATGSGAANAAGTATKLSHADHVHKLGLASFRTVGAAAPGTVVAGAAAAGAVTLTGAKIGDKVLALINLTDAADGSGSFEATITVADQIQQSSASNLSTKKYLVLLLAQSA